MEAITLAMIIWHWRHRSSYISTRGDPCVVARYGWRQVFGNGSNTITCQGGRMDREVLQKRSRVSPTQKKALWFHLRRRLIAISFAKHLT
jgi:hypothetical protein